MKFWLTDTEYRLFQSRMKELRIVNKGDFLRKMALYGHVMNVDLKELYEISRLYSITANNVNQIARRMNSGGDIYLSDIEEIQARQNELGNIMLTLKEALLRIAGM